MAYIRKTRDVYEIQVNYGFNGYECVTCEETLMDAKRTLRDYRENEPQYPSRIIKKREKISNEIAGEAV